MAEAEAGPQGRGITRRVVLRDGSAIALAVMVSGPASALAEVAVPVDPRRPVFLGDRQMRALRALVDRFIPGRPEDIDHGAVAAGCAEAIDALLGAFRRDPPKIYAGAPFSDRAGSRVNYFKSFLPLDAYEESAWRLRINGSRGRRRYEFNGPVKGWQATYREGLAALDRSSGGDFAALPGPARDLVLRGDDPAIAELVDIAFPHTYEFMYGAPEYGGNRNLVGWNYSNYDGDKQPRGWTRAQIEQPDPSPRQADPTQLAPSLRAALPALAALGASPEAAHGIIARSGGTLSGLREQIAPVLEHLRAGDDDGA